MPFPGESSHLQRDPYSGPPEGGFSLVRALQRLRMPPAPASSEPVAEAPTPLLAYEPEKEDTKMSDTTIAPAGQAVVTDGDNHGHAGLWAMAGDHRTSSQLAFEGRFDAQANLTTMLALKDSESRAQERFGDIKALILSEGDKTRHCIMQTEIDKLRHENTKLSVTARA